MLEALKDSHGGFGSPPQHAPTHLLPACMHAQKHLSPGQLLINPVVMETGIDFLSLYDAPPRCVVVAAAFNVVRASYAVCKLFCFSCNHAQRDEACAVKAPASRVSPCIRSRAAGTRTGSSHRVSSPIRVRSVHEHKNSQSINCVSSKYTFPLFAVESPILKIQHRRYTVYTHSDSLLRFYFIFLYMCTQKDHAYS